MYGRSLDNYMYKTLTEQHIVEWVRSCLSGVSDDIDIIIPEHIIEDIKSLSDSLAEFICLQKSKQKQKDEDANKSPYII
jgi:hypothetical protein